MTIDVVVSLATGRDRADIQCSVQASPAFPPRGSTEILLSLDRRGFERGNLGDSISNVLRNARAVGSLKAVELSRLIEFLESRN